MTAAWPVRRTWWKPGMQTTPTSCATCALASAAPPTQRLRLWRSALCLYCSLYQSLTCCLSVHSRECRYKAAVCHRQRGHVEVRYRVNTVHCLIRRMGAAGPAPSQPRTGRMARQRRSTTALTQTQTRRSPAWCGCAAPGSAHFLDCMNAQAASSQ